jgi:hypothetical protein
LLFRKVVKKTLVELINFIIEVIQHRIKDIFDLILFIVHLRLRIFDSCQKLKRKKH